MKTLLRYVTSIDWVLLLASVGLSLAGLITMYSLGAGDNFFQRQVVWLFFGVLIFIISNFVDWRFLKRTSFVVTIFVSTLSVLLLLFILGSVFKGAQSWFSVGMVSIQPSEPAKLVLILLLAKYFTRRHIEIAHIRHILVSGIYAFILFFLVFLQPDFGSAIILFFVWLGMVLVSGISKKHLFAVIGVMAVSFCILWFFVFQDYQKARIVTFINPLADIQGAGYNAYQSTIAVGSGQILGKGIGFGSQSKLKFLPEYQTDFVFAAFAEEWGFLGIGMVFVLFALIIWRLLLYVNRAGSNFEALCSLGVVLLFVIHFVIHVGMNIGIMPVTGITMPFMSYGGSHLLTEFFALGVIVGMHKSGERLVRSEGKDLVL